MKNRQSSIYRELENIFGWITTVCDRVPNTKSLCYQVERLNNELIDIMTACSMALNQPNQEQRLELLNLMVYHLTIVTTIIRNWHQWSSMKGQVVRILSNKQLVFFNTEVEKLNRQISGWIRSTSSSFRKEEPNNSENI